MRTSTIRLWQLISPGLPVGAFAYSQGLEYLIESRLLEGEDAVSDWITDLLEHGIGRLDLPFLLRLQAAADRGDGRGFDLLCDRLAAFRETAELRAEDVNTGTALARLLEGVGIADHRRPMPFAAGFAIACAAWRIPAAEACAGYAWAWCESQVAAAVKLVPLGHTAGQRMLLALGERIGPVVEFASELADEELGNCLPGLAIVSARHETQYTRLFRS